MAKKKDVSGLAIPAGVLLGLGIGGGIYGMWAAGVLIGLGLGFLTMLIVNLIRK